MLANSLPKPGNADGSVFDQPFPGLRPFFEREARGFFGRERETAAILDLLEQQQLVVVHGSSGCGKSSVVRAGVVPVFRLDALANSAVGKVIIIRPGDADGPLQALARKLEREFPRLGESEDSEVQSWARLLSASPDWRRDISAIVSAAGATLCIIIDQFEEIFAVHRTAYGPEVRRVIEFLISLGEPAPEGTALGKRALSVILTMRSDYLGHCAVWDGFAEAVNRCQYLLPKLSNVGLLRAIHEPGRRGGPIVDEAVADRLLPTIGREVDGLPILQHALMRSWQKAGTVDGRKVIDLDALEAAGGVEGALSKHANEAYALATEEDPDRLAAADWIFRSLSDLDSDGRIIRRSVSLEQLAYESGADIATVRSILDVFRDPTFSLVMPFTPEELDDSSIVSVSHEALLRQWDRITDSRFDETGRPRGLVYREFQDGMVWRALALQAEVFARDGTSVLGAAATEQRLPWYREIQARPGWVARHAPQGAQESGADRSHWTQVGRFMEASERNLVQETTLVERLKRNQRISLILSIVVVLLVIVTGFLVGKNAQSLAQAKLAKVETEKNTALQRAKSDQLKLFVVQTETANELARRSCIGSGKSGEINSVCFKERVPVYLSIIRGNDYSTDRNHQDLPGSPYAGAVGALPGDKQ